VLLLTSVRLTGRRRVVDEVEPSALNASKTDLVCYSTSCRQRQLSSTALIEGRPVLQSSTNVFDLGGFIDADLSMRRTMDCSSFDLESHYGVR